MNGRILFEGIRPCWLLLFLKSKPWQFKNLLFREGVWFFCDVLSKNFLQPQTGISCYLFFLGNNEIKM